MPRRLVHSFFTPNTLTIAEQLLGKLIVRTIDGHRLSGVIVESEAYLSQADPASHSHRGSGRRNASMYLPAGHLYVYAIHAKYCMNIVTAVEGIGEAVLIRALEPWEGIDTMHVNRGLTTSEPTANATASYRDLCSGPARLCQSLQIDTTCDGVNLVDSDSIWIEDSPAAVSARPFSVTATPRIGISQAREEHFRFFIDGHRCVSGLARQHRARREWLFQSAPSR